MCPLRYQCGVSYIIVFVYACMRVCVNGCVHVHSFDRRIAKWMWHLRMDGMACTEEKKKGGRGGEKEEKSESEIS